MKIGLCTGGGDCPGLNSIIRAAVRHGIQEYGYEIIGIRDSFNGLMSRPYRIRPLDLEAVSGILLRGGTILGTTNAGNPFQFPTGANKKTCDLSSLVLEAYKDLGLDAIIAIGGDGTHTIAYELSKLGINMIGVPKTIDNDLPEADETVGFDTAVQVATDAISRLQSTAESHERIMILEVMGRHTGHIALHAGIAAGAHIILIPEIPFSYEAILRKIVERRQRGKAFSVIVVAEGSFEAGQSPLFQSVSAGKQTLGGIGQHIAQTLSQRHQIESRVTVLGHVQRGGLPTHRDRILGTMYGVRSIDMAHRKQFGKIISRWRGDFHEVEYQKVAGQYREVDKEDVLLGASRSVGICLGD
ncbi:MAG: 6-phosphofructokinase [Oligoflexus sp.]